jgi:hypothetical protein
MYFISPRIENILQIPDIALQPTQYQLVEEGTENT